MTRTDGLVQDCLSMFELEKTACSCHRPIYTSDDLTDSIVTGKDEIAPS